MIGDTLIPQPGSVAYRLQRDFEAWFGRLQAISPHALDPDEWTGRWYDEFTPEAALAAGPDQD